MRSTAAVDKPAPGRSTGGGEKTPMRRWLLDLLYEWAETEATIRRILVDNPALLYGFDP